MKFQFNDKEFKIIYAQNDDNSYVFTDYEVQAVENLINLVNFYGKVRIESIFERFIEVIDIIEMEELGLMDFGKILKEKRKENGYSQEYLAEKIGVNRVNISNYELGLKVPSLAVMWKLADFLNCSIDELIGRKNFVNRKED